MKKGRKAIKLTLRGLAKDLFDGDDIQDIDIPNFQEDPDDQVEVIIVRSSDGIEKRFDVYSATPNGERGTKFFVTSL